jgi:hypothetical protein
MPGRKPVRFPGVKSQIIEFIGVYDADSTLRGEISYWIGARLGRTHCSLCEITHGLFTQKKQWGHCQEELPVPFLTFHRNDAPQDVLAATQGQFPIVLMRTSDSLSVVASSAQLDAMQGSPDYLLHHILEIIGS